MANPPALTEPPSKTKKSRLSLSRQIAIGLLVGTVCGGLVSHFDPSYADLFKPFSDLFLRLIKMIIAPLIFSSLVTGISGAGSVKNIGRMGIKAFAYFEGVALCALALGLLVVNIVRPGANATLPPGTKAPITADPQTWDHIMLHVFPESVVDAMARGDVLQIVVFAMFFAVALNIIGERGKPIIALCDAIAETMYKFTNIVMHYAPIGVGAAIAFTIGKGGLGVLVNMAWLVGSLYLALCVFVLVVLIPVMLVAKISPRKFWTVVREPALIAFSTTSSEAALPRAMAGMERLGVPRRIVSFIVPLGYSFNLDGSTLYLALAAIFVAQVGHIDVSVGQQILLMFTLMLTSKGVAAVPRASFIILAGTLASFHLPLEGMTLILGVDTLLDMGRTTINVVGNCLASAVIARWEGVYEEAELDELKLAVQSGDF